MKLQDESYMHAAARGTVAVWLSNILEQVRDDYVQFGPLGWRAQRRIYEEYPIVKEHEALVWDEMEPEWGDHPTYEQLAAVGRYPLMVLDIAIPHKGMICNAVEIRHKHAVTPEKRALLQKLHIKWIELDASWVLSQVRQPTNEDVIRNCLNFKRMF